MGQVAIVDSFFPPALIFIYMTAYIDFYPIRGKPLQQWNPPFFSILFHEKWVPPNPRKQLISSGRRLFGQC